MIDITASLYIIFNHSFIHFSNFVISYLNDRFNNELPNSLTSELTHFVCQPIWARFKRANINYDNNEEGIEDFLYNLGETFADSFNDFLTSTKAHIEYLTSFVDSDLPNTPFEKQIISSIMPINQKIDQELDATNLASGTTGQQTSEITQVGIAWRKALQRYYTPIYQKEFIDRFKWLFKLVFNAYYDYRETSSKGFKVEFEQGTLGEPEYVDIFHFYYRFDDRALWFEIDTSEPYLILNGVEKLQVKVSTDAGTDISYIRMNGTDDRFDIESTDGGETVESELYTLDNDVVITYSGYTEG